MLLLRLAAMLAAGSFAILVGDLFIAAIGSVLSSLSYDPWELPADTWRGLTSLFTKMSMEAATSVISMLVLCLSSIWLCLTPTSKLVPILWRIMR